jgi:hypothetical protein
MRKIAWLKNLAPFGGITRIRFKGFVPAVAKRLSLCGSPALISENKTRLGDVNKL